MKPLDSKNGWVDHLPNHWQPYARLSRLDRPVGWQLLFIPCFLGLSLGFLVEPNFTRIVLFSFLFCIGAIAMRGAGCNWNDILDRNIDKKVERTAGRPLPSGQLSVRMALIWTLSQVFVGFGVFLILPLFAKGVALLALPMVVVYPLMKRFFAMPQIWLAFTFQIGVLVGYSTMAGRIDIPILMVYLGLVAWMVYYDSVYACQDMWEDADAKIKSAAVSMNAYLRQFFMLCVVATLVMLTMGIWLMAMSVIDSLFVASVLTITAIAPFGIHLVGQQLMKLPDTSLRKVPSSRDKGKFLVLFKSNVSAGLLLCAGAVLMMSVKAGFY